jgi:hypothetical protein
MAHAYNLDGLVAGPEEQDAVVSNAKPELGSRRPEFNDVTDAGIQVAIGWRMCKAVWRSIARMSARGW